MNVKAQVSQKRCLFAQQSTESPKLLKGHRRRTAVGIWVAAQKSPHNSIWQGKPACWCDPESNRSSPGPRDIKR